MQSNISAFKKWFTVGVAGWISFVFGWSLPYKFTLHPHTQDIFGAIGGWMTDVFHPVLGQAFTSYGSYVIGIAELVALIFLVSGSVFLFLGRPCAAYKIKIGAALSGVLMVGAVFFHLFTPLGIKVVHGNTDDGGGLFMMAVSILILSWGLFGMYGGFKQPSTQ